MRNGKITTAYSGCVQCTCCDMHAAYSIQNAKCDENFSLAQHLVHRATNKQRTHHLYLSNRWILCMWARVRSNRVNDFWYLLRAMHNTVDVALFPPVFSSRSYLYFVCHYAMLQFRSAACIFKHFTKLVHSFKLLIWIWLIKFLPHSKLDDFDWIAIAIVQSRSHRHSHRWYEMLF